MSGLCTNCNSSLHARCCARCGSQKFARGRIAEGHAYCTAACEKCQARVDKLSDEIERELQVPRLTKNVRAGLGAIRSLASVTACNGDDMTSQEIGEMQAAIRWLDYQMEKKR